MHKIVHFYLVFFVHFYFITNKFDKNKKDENLKICVNYIFEYFNNYLDITELEKTTIAKEEKLDKYRKKIKKL